MIVLRGHPYEWEVATPTAATVGVFDGVHVGHRRVLGDLVSDAGDLVPAVITFDPHPLSILAPKRAPLMLTDVDQRIEQFQALGIGLAGVLNFPDIRDLSAKEFSERVLCDGLQVKRVVVGADFRFGRGREGDAGFLGGEGKRLGFDVDVVDMFGALDGIVSSTRIREVLLAGDVEAAAEMLARPYQLNGVVVEGERRGRDLGFPTANLEIESKRLIPANGVYAGWALVDGERHPSAINIGVRPTFSETERRVEAHLLDFEGDLYGHKLAVDFVARLRSEQKFDGIEALRNQIAQDAHAARARLP
ncbi:MAG: bifunctional riboflavin kinase/FAD synthetase [Acidimicrobiia bacterium]